MNSSNKERLKFRYQYLLTPQSIECPFLHIERKVSDTYILYTHVDLPVQEHSSGNLKLVLLGDIFDFRYPAKSNKDILKDLAELSWEDFIRTYSEYSGRYALLYVIGTRLILLHDATGARKVYYSIVDNAAWFGSQPYLLSQILNLNETQDPSKKAFYQSHIHKFLNNTNVGDTTRYDEIRQLMPNHYFDPDQLKSFRFWPVEPISLKPHEEVAVRIAEMIRGYVEGIALRYKVMIPVTAGKDSRILAAAATRIREDVFFYVNKEPHLSRFHKDIFVPSRLFKKAGTKFHILEFEDKVDEDFRKIYFQNNPYASEFYLPHIFNYYSHFNSWVNLPGNMASPIWNVENSKGVALTPAYLAEIYGVTEFEFAVNCYSNWLNGIQELSKLSNIDIIRLFYWEERLANWGGQVTMDKDIAGEDFNPFNSRLLVSEFYSVDYQYLKKPHHIFYKEIVRILWPELLSMNINPVFIRGISKLLKISGLYNHLRALSPIGLLLYGSICL